MIIASNEPRPVTTVYYLLTQCLKKAGILWHGEGREEEDILSPGMYDKCWKQCRPSARTTIFPSRHLWYCRRNPMGPKQIIKCRRIHHCQKPPELPVGGMDVLSGLYTELPMWQCGSFFSGGQSRYCGQQPKHFSHRAPYKNMTVKLLTGCLWLETGFRTKLSIVCF